MPATYYWNTSTKTWDNAPYMIKEHTSYNLGPYKKWAATMVVVPMEKMKDGEKVTIFVPMGVRIEDLSTRKEAGPCQIPGQTYFFKSSSGMVSETGAYQYQTHKMGFYHDQKGRPSDMTSPTLKTPGVPLKDHRLGKWVGEAVAVAQNAYAAYCEAKRGS